MPETKTNKLSIYLIKSEFQQISDIVDCDELPQTIASVGEFFFERSHPHTPSWVNDFFGSTLNISQNILASSAKGLLLIPVQTGNATQYFALSFGVGRYLLKDGVVEERFGLKVVLNSVDLGSFRSIGKTTLSSVPKQSHEQMSKTVTPDEFGIDIEQDLVSSVTGRSRDQRFGKTISGKDALSVSVKVDITKIHEFLNHCLTRYRSDDYKRDFDWIDQIAEVRDVRKELALNEALIQKLNDGDFGKVWMAVPDVVDWADAKGFRYGRPKRSDLHDDLDVSTFISTLKGVPVTMELLKGQYVFMIASSTDSICAKWSAFRCLYAELALNGELFVLNNGKWYGIASDFMSQVLTDYGATAISSLPLPDCTVNDEGEYNIAASQSLAGSCCMDRNLIQYGGGHSSIEFCDVFTNDKKMVHVKRYAGSSVLSHLFSQGIVSGELFVSDPGFRQKLNTQLPSTHQLTDPAVRPNASEYEVVYAIISNSTSPLEIPFFSKVTLRNAKRRLMSFGYRVSTRKIQKVASAA